MAAMSAGPPILAHLAPLQAELLAYARTRTRSQEAAEDVLRAAIVIAIEKEDMFDLSSGPSGLRAWMKAIIRNVAAREGRTQAKQRLHEEAWNSPGGNDYYATAGDEAEVAAAGQDDWDDLRAHLERLREAKFRLDKIKFTERQAACLLAHLKGEDQMVTAEKLGIAQPTVHEHLQAAIKKLRACNLDGYDPDAEIEWP